MSAVDFAEMMDVEYSVDEYFEPEELAKMSPIEKRRYKNLRANYEVMKAMSEYTCIKGPRHTQKNNPRHPQVET